MNIFTTEIAEQALDMSSGYIENLLAHHSGKAKPSLYVAFVNPISGKISAIRKFGANADDYREVAEAKAHETHREQMSTAELSVRPHLLQGGDTMFWGSGYLLGLSVGASGAESYIDEAASYTVAASGLMLCKQKQVLMVDKKTRFVS